MTHFAKCQKDLNVSKAQQTWGLGFVVLLGKQLWIEAKTQEEVERPERHCVFFAHFSLDSSFHFFSLRPLSYAVFIQIIFTQSCFNLCWQYCVRVTQDKLWSCELHGNWIQVQTVRRREEDAHKSTKWDQWKCQKTQIEVPVCVQTELSKD